jgi:hypothetical protein
MEGGTIHLCQTGLIDRILACLDLSDSTKTKDTPCTTDVLGAHIDEPPLSTDWNYHSKLGKMQFLNCNTRCDPVLAVNQLASFSNDLRRPHQNAMMRLGRYLLATHNKGMIILKLAHGRHKSGLLR